MGIYTSNFILANGIHIHYSRSPVMPGRLPIVLLHGLTDNGLCWIRVADALCDWYDPIMPDARGSGRSDKPECGYTIEDRATDAAALITALSLDRPVVMGASLGGMDALAVAALYPDLVQGVILEDPAWLDQEPGPEEAAAFAQDWRNRLVQEQSQTRAELMAFCRQEEPLWHDEEIGPWADSQLQMDPDILVKTCLAYRGSAWREFLKKARCPIMLITTEKEGEPGWVPPEMVREALSLSDQVREAHLTGAGHCVHRDQFEPSIRVVKEFLEELHPLAER